MSYMFCFRSCFIYQAPKSWDPPAHDLRTPPLGVILFFGHWVDHLTDWDVVKSCNNHVKLPIISYYIPSDGWMILSLPLCDNDCWVKTPLETPHGLASSWGRVVFIPHEKWRSFESLFPGKQQVWCSSKLGVLQNEVVFPFMFFKFTSFDDEKWIHQFRNLPNEALTALVGWLCPVKHPLVLVVFYTINIHTLSHHISARCRIRYPMMMTMTMMVIMLIMMFLH